MSGLLGWSVPWAGGRRHRKSHQVASLLVVMALAAGACSDDGASVSEVTLPALTLGPPTTAPDITTTSTTETPVDAQLVEVGDDLSALVAAAPEGSAFLLAVGTHRLLSVVPKNQMTFRGSPGAVMSGAMLLDGFELDGDGRFWSLSGLEKSVGDYGQGNCVGDYEGCQLSPPSFVMRISASIW